MNTQGWSGAAVSAVIAGACSFTALKAGHGSLAAASLGAVLSALAVFAIAAYFIRRAHS